MSKPRVRSWRAFGIVCLAFAMWSGVNSAPLPAETHRQVLKAYADLPLAFVENRGQTDSAVRFYAEGSHYAFHLTRDAAMLSFLDRGDATRGVALVLRFDEEEERQQFTATGTFSDGSTADLTATAAWASSNTAVAGFDAPGLARGVSAGTTSITASQAGIAGAPATLTVTD